ncbi:MAG: uroporphyrinogen-III synthase [Rubrivivax sp.]
MTGATPAGEGRCALVTRPRAQGPGWQRRLAALGVHAELLPLIEIEPAGDPAALRAWFASLAGGPLPPAAAVMFVSPNAAQCFVDALTPAWQWPGEVLAAATGPGTTAVLRRAGVPAEAIVAPTGEGGGQFDSEALWALLAPRRDWAGQRVGIVRGDGGRDWLAEQWRGAGATVEFVQAYARSAPRLAKAEQTLLGRALQSPGEHAWLLSSSEAVDHLATLAPSADWAAALALASHPRIAARARQLGFGDVVEVHPTPEAVAEALARWPRRYNPATP